MTFNDLVASFNNYGATTYDGTFFLTKKQEAFAKKLAGATGLGSPRFAKTPAGNYRFYSDKYFQGETK